MKLTAIKRDPLRGDSRHEHVSATGFAEYLISYPDDDEAQLVCGVKFTALNGEAEHFYTRDWDWRVEF